MSITKTNAVTLVNSAVYICDCCGNWFSFTLWGKDKNGEPEITDIHPEYCPVCGDMPLRHQVESLRDMVARKRQEALK